MSRRLWFAFLLLAVASVAAAFAAPPNRPPMNALRRYEPKLYDVRFEVLISATAPIHNQALHGVFAFDEAPIILPVVYMGAYSKTFPGSEGGDILLDNLKVDDPNDSIDKGKPYGTAFLRMVAPKFQGRSVRWAMTYRTQTWSAAIDERRAFQSTWPRDLEWPEEAADGLKPQKFIESDHADVQTALVNKYGADWSTTIRIISPYKAAKQIVGDVVANWQMNEMGDARGEYQKLLGMKVYGVLPVIQKPGPGGRWYGTEHDLVCACVAMLRAAGIPARPVIGMVEHDMTLQESEKTTFATWAEFYLPNSGWVSFDPKELVGKMSSLSIDRPWPEFGTMEDLNERVVLSYFFMPPAGVEVAGWPGVWGWDPRPQRQPGYDQSITLQMTSRGKGEEDPR